MPQAVIQAFVHAVHMVAHTHTVGGFVLFVDTFLIRTVTFLETTEQQYLLIYYVCTTELGLNMVVTFSKRKTS
jgi:hypothetical protein